MYQRIVVSLDGSALAEAALPHALQMARLTRAPLHIVRVVDASVAYSTYGTYGTYGMAGGYMPMADMFEEDRRTAAEYLESTQSRLADDVVSVTTELRDGQVAREIVAATAEHDLLVMTSHGRGGLERWFMGSVAEEVTRHATVPVLLIRLNEDDLQMQHEAVDAAVLAV